MRCPYSRALNIIILYMVPHKACQSGFLLNGNRDSLKYANKEINFNPLTSPK